MCEQTSREDWRGVGVFYHRGQEHEGRCAVEQCEECGEYQIRVIENVSVVNPDDLHQRS